MIWYILVDQARLFWYTDDDSETNYFTVFDMFKAHDDNSYLQSKTGLELTLISMYYGMTTLTTVGFGDYYPITNFERGSGVIFLFGGVIIMSYTQGVFLDGIHRIDQLNAEIEDQS